MFAVEVARLFFWSVYSKQSISYPRFSSNDLKMTGVYFRENISGRLRLLHTAFLVWCFTEDHMVQHFLQTA